MKGAIYLAIVLLALGTASAQVVEIEGRYWFTRFQSQLLAERSGAVTVIDWKRDLGVRNQGYPEGRITFSMKRSRFRFDFTPIRYSGGLDLGRPVRFNGATFPVGSRIVSDLELNHLSFAWTYFFLNPSEGRLKIGSLLEGNGFLQTASLRAPDFGISRSTSLSVGVPAVGMSVEFRAHRLVQLKGDIAGVSVGKYGYFIRSEAGVQITPVSHISFTAGYRTFDLHADYHPDSVRLTIRGPFAGASVHF
jgi:hypothetical protein